MKKYFSNVQGVLTIADLIFTDPVTREQRILLLKPGESIPNTVPTEEIERSAKSGVLKVLLEKGMIVEKEVQETPTIQSKEETPEAIISSGGTLTATEIPKQEKVVLQGEKVIEGSDVQIKYGYLSPSSKEGKKIAEKIEEIEKQRIKSEPEVETEENEASEAEPTAEATGYLTPDSERKKSKEDEFDSILGLKSEKKESKVKEEKTISLEEFRTLKLFPQYSVIAHCNNVDFLKQIADDESLREEIRKRARNRIKRISNVE